MFGYTLSRRGLLKGAAGAAALGLGLPAGLARAQVELGTATGEVTLGSNYSDPVPSGGFGRRGRGVSERERAGITNTVDHNTFQENITTYLQNPDDVIPWFAGYRMQFFAAQDLLGPIDDVWEAGLNDNMSEGFKLASTGQDGQLYFVPWTYYAWGIHYRPSVFEENGWEVPTTMDQLMGVAEGMQSAGIVPFAFGNDGRWPAMGTFDQLNFRLNGYQFHMDLMAGKESWTDERVKNVFTEWEASCRSIRRIPTAARGKRPASAFANKEAGMMTIGNFVGQQFPEGDLSDLDFFPWPEMNPEFGTDTIEAPIDGWMMAKEPKNPDAAKELLFHFGTPAAQEAYLAEDPSSVAASLDVDSSIYNSLQLKALEAVSAAPTVTQFLDRDTSPEFASNVAGQAFADFISDPSSIDAILEDMQAQAEAIFAE